MHDEHKWMYLALFLLFFHCYTVSPFSLARNSTPSSASSQTSRRNKNHETKTISRFHGNVFGPYLLTMMIPAALVHWSRPTCSIDSIRVPVPFILGQVILDSFSSLLFMLLKNTQKNWQQLIWSTWIIVELYNLLLVAAHTHIHTRYLFLQIWPISIFPSRLLLVSFDRWLIFFLLFYIFPLEPFGQLAKIE